MDCGILGRMDTGTAQSGPVAGGTTGDPAEGMPSVTILTFGCRVNQYETDCMRATLSALGARHDHAKVYILNGCTVTRLAERKARQAARRIHRDHPGALVILVGCLADAVAQELTRFPEADLMAGNAWKARIDEVVCAALSGSRGMLPEPQPMDPDQERSAGPRGRVRAPLKVQDGCSLACTYCRPTQVRGPSRSKSVDASVREAEGLIRKGYPELVLTGINLAQYAPHDGSLADLVSDLLRLPGLLRLRLASINPSGLSHALLEAMASDRRACPHFHVPLQSGDDRILSAMQRGYTVAGYLATLDRVRKVLPEATFGADLIVGFPGEDDQAFRATCGIVEAVGYANLHVFRYSPRSGTVAAALPNAVPEGIKRQRASALTQVWLPIRDRLLDTRIGSIQDVLIEERRDEQWHGHTRDYLPVSFTSETELPLGSEQPVHILAARDGRLEGVDTHRTNTA